VISKPTINDVFNYGINLKKTIQQSPITILRMFFAGEFPHKIKAVFFLLGLRGFYGFRLWEVKMLSVRFMKVTLVYSKATCLLLSPPKCDLHSLKEKWASKLSQNGRTRKINHLHVLILCVAVTRRAAGVHLLPVASVEPEAHICDECGFWKQESAK
jgi:hypothetical protein